MKVLRKGKGWNIKVNCSGNGNGGGGCGSLLEVEKEDIYVTSSTDMIGDTDYYFTFKCPVCGVETDISCSQVPSSVRDLAYSKKRTLIPNSGWRD